MLKEIPYNKLAKEALEYLPKGAFLTVAAGGKLNTMTIGWGYLGVIWGKPCFTVMVRASRYTYGLMESADNFTVSIPFGKLKEALATCGSKSGRDIDKFKEYGLKTLPAAKVSSPLIEGCDLHFECRIIYKQALDPAGIPADVHAGFYPKKDYHTLYFGEIVACHQEE